VLDGLIVENFLHCMSPKILNVGWLAKDKVIATIKSLLFSGHPVY